MTLEDAIKTAIEFETKVKATYEDAQKKATDEPGRRVFRTLAQEEQGHVDYLRSRLTEWQKTGHVTLAKLETAIPSREKIKEGTGKLTARMKGSKNYAAELELLQRALEVEVETSSFYQRMVSELPEEGQRLFSRFLEIEQGHVAIVQAEMDSVTKLGFWFDIQEFRLEAE
jgi:rubrerythrin